MDEEERKRIAADAKLKAKKALELAVRTSPSGVAPDTREVAKARAKAALAESGSLQGTSIEEPPGFVADTMNSISRFFSEVTGGVPQAGDLDEKLTNPAKGFTEDFVGATARAPANVVMGLIDTMKNRDDRKGKIAPLTTAATAITDIMSIGTYNTAKAVEDYDRSMDDPSEALLRAQKIAAGEPVKSFQEQLDETALEQEEIRAANPGTALGADVLASIGTGGALAKMGFKAINSVAPRFAANIGRNWYARILTGSAVGGGEVFAYRMNKDGDLEQATSDAATAVLGGALLGGLFETGKGAWSIIRNVKAPDVIEEGVGSEMIRMINIERQLQGLPAAKASDVAAEIAKLGPDATLMDAYPTLRQFATHVLRNEDNAMHGDGLRAVIASRNDLMEDLLAPDGTLRTAFASKAVRGYASFSADVAKRFDRLQPRFKEIYDQYSALRFSPKQMGKNINTLFGDKIRRTANETDIVGWVEAQLKSYAAKGRRVPVLDASGVQKTTVDPITGKVKKLYKAPDELTLEQAVDLKRVVQTSAGERQLRVAGTDRVIPLNNLALRDLSRVQAYLADLIHNKVGELIPLDKVYGNIAGLKTAYKAGSEAFTKSMVDSADVTSFLMDANKSMAAKRAFTEGAKHRIFKLLNKAKTADAIDKVIVENREIFQRMEAMFGKDGLQAMIEDVRPSVVKLKTAEELRKAVPRVERPEPKSATVGETIDVATAVGGIPGVVSKAGALGAFRRLMGQAADPAEASKRREMYGGILSQMGEGASDAYRGLEDLLSRSIRPSDMGSIGRPAGAGAGFAVSGEQERAMDGELPQ